MFRLTSSKRRFVVAVGLLAMLFITLGIWQSAGREALGRLAVGVGGSLLAFLVLLVFTHLYGFSELREATDALVLTKEALDAGMVRVYRGRKGIPPEEWNEFVRRAHNHIWLYGMAEGGYARDPEISGVDADGDRERTPGILEERAQDGCEVKILLMDPEGPMAEKVGEEQSGIARWAGVTTEIQQALRVFERLRCEAGKARHDTADEDRIQVRVHAEYPQVSIVRSDSEMLVTHYLRFRRGNECFTFRIRDVANGVFASYAEHFRRMWNAPSTRVWPAESPTAAELQRV